jgi:hypothetical protein
MSYKPPYVITPIIVSLVAKISEKLGQLSVLKTQSRICFKSPFFLLFGINFFQSFIVKSPTTVFNCPNNKLGRMCKNAFGHRKKLIPKSKKNGDLKQMRDFWQMPLVQGKERIRGSDGKALHPTQKPEEMLKRIILASSNKGDIVLEPFSGSGTTAYIAKKYERQWIGIEKDKNYIKISTTVSHLFQVPIFLLFGINFFQSFIVKSPTTVFNCPNNKLGRMCKNAFGH